jgi:hypothetical protein
MAENPFGTPVAGLALEMAVRNQGLLERMPAMTENQRRLINLRLQRYGGDLSQYEPFMDVGYEPTVGSMRSQAEGMRDYLVGLPELMEKAMKEGQASGVTYKNPDTTDWFKRFAETQTRLYNQAQSRAATAPMGTADTMERWSGYQNRPAPKPPTAPRLRAQTTRPASGQVSFR